ncbi:Bacillopeptidase F [Orchesella cincta]|uniref:Bacillopeptidase F n=1 Tax=Orchesella cincta TaxID=48709 RepID=A0A1D2MGG7_ORCCI|nr:Bacillopeptidase F [Orchesella cincta]
MLKITLIIFLVGVTLNNAVVSTEKIEVSLLESLENQETVDVVITFKQSTKPVLERVERMRFENRGHKITFLKSQLEQLAKESQQGVISILRGNFSSTSFQSFWINNKLFVKNASLELVQLIGNNQDVSEIERELIIKVDGVQDKTIPVKTNPKELGWGVLKIEADQAWNLVGGTNGEGVVVASIGTGVRHTHEALRDNYRSTYGWYDPYARTRNPLDVNGHGTNTMGVLTGANGVGVAPGAQWISCRGCDEVDKSISCSLAALTSCGEWILCPTLWNGQQPDCSMAPNIVSISWNRGGRGNNFYKGVVDAWKAANIIPIFPIGDGGMACDTAQSPGDYEGVIGVGSTTAWNSLSPSSSRGPTSDGRIKPDTVAPGNNVQTICKDSDTAYCSARGTGMAVPHVAGTVAILLARDPELTYDQVLSLLQNNADRELEDEAVCGGTNSTTDWPNNIYGYGSINARRALTALIVGDL